MCKAVFFHVAIWITPRHLRPEDREPGRNRSRPYVSPGHRCQTGPPDALAARPTTAKGGKETIVGQGPSEANRHVRWDMVSISVLAHSPTSSHGTLARPDPEAGFRPLRLVVRYEPADERRGRREPHR